MSIRVIKDRPASSMSQIGQLCNPIIKGRRPKGGRGGDGKLGNLRNLRFPLDSLVKVRSLGCGV